MRQLDEQGISILPILIEDCEVPPLLKDIKYAKFNGTFEVEFTVSGTVSIGAFSGVLKRCV